VSVELLPNFGQEPHPSELEQNPFAEPDSTASGWPGPPAVEPRIPAAVGTLVATPLSEITMRSIEWLEKPLWQGSAFQLLAGPKGAGKGTYLAALAARRTRAGENVLFVSTEDSAAIDLKPRLVAAGAVIERCYLVSRHIKLPGDLASLRELAEVIGRPGLLVIDPVANHIGDRNSNSEAEVRDCIAPLNGLADELGCLIVGVRHPGKDRSRGAVASVLGSTAWVDTPRAVVMIVPDDEDEHLRHIQVVAGNRSLNGSAQAFRIEPVTVAGLDEPITLAVELGESAKSVDELLSREAVPGKRVPAERVQEILLRELEQGERARRALDEAVLRETGANPDSVYKSGLKPLREEGRIKARKDGPDGPWCWRLANPADRTSDFGEWP
jgi:hypothetical protein